MNNIAREYGIRFIGPNCLGLMDTHSKFCCFFGATPEKFSDIGSSGSVSYVVQSGGVGALILESLRSDAAKVNKIVSIGNKADMDEADLIEYFQHDNTEGHSLYLENVRDGNKLLKVAQSSTKPILAYKVGRTQEGAQAATSHTAGMANNDTVFESACRQAGIIRVDSISELSSMPKIFDHHASPEGKTHCRIHQYGCAGKHRNGSAGRCRVTDGQHPGRSPGTAEADRYGSTMPRIQSTWVWR